MEFISSLDFWTFVVAVLALLATVWYGREQLRFARQEAQTAREEAQRTVRNQEEQLQLARRAAEHRPMLEVATMGLVDATEVDTVLEADHKRQEWLDTLEQHELAVKEHERRRKEIDNSEETGVRFTVFDRRIPAPPPKTLGTFARLMTTSY